MYTCNNGCCIIKHEQRARQVFRRPDKTPRAGWFLYDKSQDRVLLVQSTGAEKWGIPKGRSEQGETARQTADRECLEETGLDLSTIEPDDSVLVDRQDVYYCKNITCTEVKVQPNVDAHAISWLKISCLMAMIINGQMEVNRPTKQLFHHVFGACLPVEGGGFVIVKKH